MASLTPDQLVEAAKRAGEKMQGVLSKRDFHRLTGIGDHHIYRCFPDGGWREVLKRAGLEEKPSTPSTRISDQDLLKEYHRVVGLLGAKFSWARFASHAKVGKRTLTQRFGDSEQLRKRYLEWLSKQKEEPSIRSPVLNQGETKVEAVPDGKFAHCVPSEPSGPTGKTVLYGAPINFRGLRHAPINEQGVVYLFGVVSHELGFLVEAVHSAYPDCDAKRRVKGKQNRWQRVRIEFEFVSSNFHAHGHDPKVCDLVVCWEHDWPKCPLEVIELQSEIKNLPQE